METRRHLVSGRREHLRLLQSEGGTRRRATRRSNIQSTFPRRRIPDSARPDARPLDHPRPDPFHAGPNTALSRLSAAGTGLERDSLRCLLLRDANRELTSARLQAPEKRQNPNTKHLRRSNFLAPGI